MGDEYWANGAARYATQFADKELRVDIALFDAGAREGDVLTAIDIAKAASKHRFEPFKRDTKDTPAHVALVAKATYLLSHLITLDSAVSVLQYDAKKWWRAADTFFGQEFGWWSEKVTSTEQGESELLRCGFTEEVVGGASTANYIAPGLADSGRAKFLPHFAYLVQNLGSAQAAVQVWSLSCDNFAASMYPITSPPPRVPKEELRGLDIKVIPAGCSHGPVVAEMKGIKVLEVLEVQETTIHESMALGIDIKLVDANGKDLPIKKPRCVSSLGYVTPVDFRLSRQAFSVDVRTPGGEQMCWTAELMYSKYMVGLFAEEVFAELGPAIQRMNARRTHKWSDAYRILSSHHVAIVLRDEKDEVIAGCTLCRYSAQEACATCLACVADLDGPGFYAQAGALKEAVVSGIHHLKHVVKHSSWVGLTKLYSDLSASDPRYIGGDYRMETIAIP